MKLLVILFFLFSGVFANANDRCLPTLEPSKFANIEDLDAKAIGSETLKKAIRKFYYPNSVKKQSKLNILLIGEIPTYQREYKQDLKYEYVFIVETGWLISSSTVIRVTFDLKLAMYEPDEQVYYGYHNRGVGGHPIFGRDIIDNGIEALERYEQNLRRVPDKDNLYPKLYDLKKSIESLLTESSQS